MRTTKNNFSPSVNIVRDNDYDFNYIVTPNASEIFNRLFEGVLGGAKAQTIIGAYGTGKSSFLLAMQQTFNGHKKHFLEAGQLISQLPSFEFFNIVGDFASFIENVAAAFFYTGEELKPSEVIKAIEKRYKKLQREGKGVAIVVDEFGKFLEYAAKNNPEAELYFIQQLAEWVNEQGKEAIFITTLHQDFNAYSSDLNKSQREEWSKVRGRLKDLVFNEPVEQLLLLAAERINQKFPLKNKDKNFDKLFELIKESKAFPLRDYLEPSIALKLKPFDILSAAILALSLQRYGQNERSLFSFIESSDHLSLSDFKSEQSYYSIPQVYDYLLNNFYGLLTTSKNNSHYPQWAAIRRSLERIEGILPPDIWAEAAALIKSIGLLNIFSSAAGKLDRNFYISYGKLALGLKDPAKAIEELEKYKVIRYAAHNLRYSLLEGTDLDIDLAIDNAGRLIERSQKIVSYLNEYFDFPFISAKAVSYKRGTPRFFQFKLSEEPITEAPEGEVDGFVNLVFAEGPNAEEEVRSRSKQNDEAILFGYYRNTAEIKDQIYYIQKVRTVINANANDKAALKELTSIEEAHIRLLNHYVLDSLYADNGNVIWYYKGHRHSIKSRQSFNQKLSEICEDVYFATPDFKSELVNKTKVSTQISNARRSLVIKLLQNLSERDLGFESNKFPPERSIYLSLLGENTTGLHRLEEGAYGLYDPTNFSFGSLWKAGEVFLASTKEKARSVQEFIDILLSKPFKLKQGFVDFWLPIFLIAKKDEYALYNENHYIAQLDKDDLDLIYKKPFLFKIKSFNVGGIRLELFNRYRTLLNQSETSRPSNKQFIQTIKPFIVFYKDLNEYAKQTKRTSKDAVALRTVIAAAKDPEKTFFEDFPGALGFTVNELQSDADRSEQFIKKLQGAIKELNRSYDHLLDRLEEFVSTNVLGEVCKFPEYKEELASRFKEVKRDLLTQDQKTFITCINSPIDERDAWLNALGQAILKKSLASIRDEEEAILYEKIKDRIYELDNLSDISKVEAAEGEEIMKLEITSLVKGLNQNIIRIPKAKSAEVNRKSSEIEQLLSKDKNLNITILTKVLQKLLNNE